MQTKIFIHNLSAITQESELQDLFAAYGTIVSVQIIKDLSGDGRGIGFVEMTTQVSAEAAIRGLNMHELHSRRLNMRFADATQKKSNRRWRHGR